MLKVEFYRKKVKAENLEQLTDNIKYCIHKVNNGVITKMIKHAKKHMKAKDHPVINVIFYVCNEILFSCFSYINKTLF